MRRGILGLMLLAIAGGTLLAGDKDDPDVEKIQGVWDIKSLEARGKKMTAPEEGGGSFSFSKDLKVVLKEKGQLDRNGTFKVDSSKSPKELELSGHLLGPKNDKATAVIPCIYKLDGDTLQIAVMAEGPKAGRPSGFAAKDVAILTLKRQSK